MNYRSESSTGSEKIMRNKKRKSLGKLICAGLCVVMFAGCGSGENVDLDVSQQTGMEGAQAVESGKPSAEQAVVEDNTVQGTDSQVDIQGNRVVVDDILYDDVLNPIGAILSKEIIIYSETQPEMKVYQFHVTWPEIDVSFDGADKINETMLEYVDHMAALMTEDEQWISEVGEEQGLSFNSSFEGFSYRDDHYISFIQNEYEYSGGAHGMPYYEPFTFHLQSGEQLELADIIGNSEEELKEMVTEYFAQMIDKAPDEYWENAEEIVRESINMESDFLLTQEGIQFYFLPYDIAPYAAGFPAVVVPFEKWDMKIVLE